MKYYFKLDSIIDKINVKKIGKYNGFSIILIGGSSYKPIHFDKVDFNKNFYEKFNYEKKYPNINFQKNLSKITTTFSFDRPTDLLNHNIYDGDNYDFYIASKRDLTIKKYAKFIKTLLEYYNIKPPYVLIGFSEGCYDIYSFIKYYSNSVKKVFFIDAGLVGPFMNKYEFWRGNKKWWLSIKNDTFPKINTTQIDIKDKKILEQIDVYNFNIKFRQFFKNYNDLINFDKNIPIYLCWAKYHYGKDGWINYKSSPSEILQLKKQFCKYMKKNKYNIKCKWFNAPHQIERVLPITLHNYIINNI